MSRGVQEHGLASAGLCVMKRGKLGGSGSDPCATYSVLSPVAVDGQYSSSEIRLAVALESLRRSIIFMITSDSKLKCETRQEAEIQDNEIQCNTMLYIEVITASLRNPVVSSKSRL